MLNCHLATKRIGIPGSGPLSLTGQPNAMGGREAGGLANQLAAHMGFSADEINRVGRFWGATRMARREGLKAVAMMERTGRHQGIVDYGHQSGGEPAACRSCPGGPA